MHANTAVGWPITHMSCNYISVQGQLEGKLDPVDIQLSKQAWGRMEDVLGWIKYSQANLKKKKKREKKGEKKKDQN